MADVAKRIVGPLYMQTASTNHYQVPTATTCIIRNIHITNTTANLLSFNLAIGSATVISNCFYYQFPVPPNGAVDWSGFMVMAAAEQLQSQASVGSSLLLTVSGIEVS